MQIRLTHHHGLGNAFLVADTRQLVDGVALDQMSIDWVTAAMKWCDPDGGIGADGLLLLGGSGSHMTMRLINADGSPAEMSGLHPVQGTPARLSPAPRSRAQFRQDGPQGQISVRRLGPDARL